MKHRMLSITAMVFVLWMIALAADDPFTGTWRDRMVEFPLMVLAPASGGISIQEGTGKPEIYPYGEDTPVVPSKGMRGGFKSTRNIVRIDSHTIKGTLSVDGNAMSNATGTASADGKHYTLATDYSDGSKGTTEYDRVGPVPSGDLFFGTWKRAVSEDSPARTIVVDGDSFEWSAVVPEGRPGTGAPGLSGKFDGKEYPGRGIFSTFTFVLKRIDARTVEITAKTHPLEIPKDRAANLSPEVLASVAKSHESKEIWQVKGDILTITSRNEGDSLGESRVQEFERVK